MIARMMKPSKKKPTIIPPRETPYRLILESHAIVSSPQVIIKANQSPKESPPNDKIADTDSNNADSKWENRSWNITETDGYINKSFRNEGNNENQTVNEVKDNATKSGKEIGNRGKKCCQLSSPSFFLLPPDRDALRERRPTTTKHIESVRGNV